MNAIFISRFFPINSEYLIKNLKVMPQYSASKVSYLLYEGFKENGVNNLKIINVPPITSFPFSNKLFMIPKKKISDGISVGFCNISIIRQLSIFKSIVKEIKNLFKVNDNYYIIAYSMTTPILLAIKKAKLLNKNTKTCLIVPDLPHFMNMSSGKLYKFLKAIDIKIQKRLLKNVDYFVLFTEHMNEVINVSNNQCMVMEGIVKKESLDSLKNNNRDDKKDKKIILYTGALEEKYGITNLLNAIKLIDNKNYIFQFAGNGSVINEVKRLSQIDKRVQYLGVLPNEEVVKLQRDADLLVNPRSPENIYTKYSFPSKNIEYIISGTPLICFKLDGIPEEYNDLVYYFKNNTASCMAKQIEEVCEQPYETRFNFASKAQQYIFDNKNNCVQAKKILDFISKEHDREKI